MLLSGSVLAQLFSLLASPVLTRIYAPDAFGKLAIFVSIVAVLSPGIGGRYEMAAIVSPKTSEARDFVFIAKWVTTVLCLLLLLLLMVAFSPMVELMNAKVLGGWIWLMPLALFLTSAITILRSWANAIKKYAPISISSVVQVLSVTLLAIMLGFTQVLNDGLLYANLFGLILTCSYLGFVFRDLFCNYEWCWNKRRWKLALLHKEYPIVNATTSTLNGFMTSLPVFFIAFNFSQDVVGFYALLIRVGVAPLSFISEAISQVNIKKISDLLHQKQNPIPYFRKVTLALLAIVSVPSAIFILFAPQLFVLFFGPNWRGAGEILVILMPALALQFVVSTLSLSFIASGHLRLLAVWQVLSFITTALVFTVVGNHADIVGFFWAYMVKDLILYSVYYIMMVYAINHPNLRHSTC